MSKFYGAIGFAVTEETGLDVFTETITERKYYGEMSKVYRRNENGLSVNEGLSLSNELSIVADPFVNENLASIRYVVWMNTKWTVTSVEVKSPRLILGLGGIYNA